jgi:outer membrane protein
MVELVVRGGHGRGVVTNRSRRSGAWKGAAVLACLLGLGGPVSAQQTDTLRLTLADAVRLGAERSAQAEVERLAEEESEASVATERSALLPHVSVEAAHGDRTFNTASFGLDFPVPEGGEPLFDPAGEVVGPVRTVDVRGHVAQTLFDWGAIQRVRQARLELDADRVRTDVARERAAAAAGAAFVQARRAEGRLAARTADVSLNEELLRVSRELLSAGVGVRLDVTRAEAQLSVLRAELVTARADAARARLALLRSLNLPLETVVAVAPGPQRPARTDDPAGEVAGALARRPDVAELDRRIAAARQEVSAVRAERLPTVALGVGDGFTGRSYDHLLNTYEWAVRISVPAFDGGRHARADAGQARARSLEVRRLELAEQVEYEIRDAMLRVESARELVTASGVRLGLAEAELEQARERFAAGVAGSADVFTASLRLNEARTAAVDADAALEAARLTLAIAEGVLLVLR